MELTLSTELVRAVRSAQARVPEQVRRQAEGLVTDSVAISLAAATLSETAGRAIQGNSAGVTGGSSHIFGSSGGFPPAVAAFGNAALAHSLDFDDTHDLARLHTTTVTLPAALAVGELVDAPGALVLDGMILGAEVMCRLGLAAKPAGTGPTSLWFLTQLVGYIGAAIAASIVLELDDAQMVSAIGLAYSQAAGGKEAAVSTGSDARSIYPAFAAAGGVTAALLARAGVVGPATALDGATGFWSAYLGGPPDAEVRATLLDIGQLGESGQAWKFSEIVVKPWPSCRMAHPYLDAVFALPAITAPIEAVSIAVNPSAARLCAPLDERRRPRTLPDATFSIPYMTALALTRGTVDLSVLETAVLNDEAVHQMVDRITVEQTLPDTPGNPRAEITVSAGGKIYQAVGRADVPTSPQQLHDKLADCLRAAQLTATPQDLLGIVDELSTGSSTTFMTRMAALSGPAVQPKCPAV